MAIKKYVPPWEMPCWLHAICETTGAPEAKVKKLALKEGWDGKSQGLAAAKVIGIVWVMQGKMPDLTMTKIAKGKTAKQFSGERLGAGKSGMVFTRDHVMPMVNGVVSNFNGYGDDEVVIVATY